MAKLIRRSSPATHPMPQRLDDSALLRVSDEAGRILRTEELSAGTDLRRRLATAHQNYRIQGWAVDDLRLGTWAFVARKGDRQLMVAIRAGIPTTVSSTAATAPFG